MTPAALIARLREMHAVMIHEAANIVRAAMDYDTCEHTNKFVCRECESIGKSERRRGIAKRDEADALAEAIRRIELSTWREIASAPKDDWVVVWWDGPTMAIYTNTGWTTEYGQTSYGDNPDGNPTHWQPLPHAPETGDV